MQGLTGRQEQVLGFIREHIVSKQFPPTVREIGEHFGMRSTNAVNDHLAVLARKGWITRDAMVSRGIVVLGAPAVATATAQPSVGSFGDLTPRQAQVLACIREHVAAHGRPPTLRELGKSLGIRSTRGVSEHIHALERKGFVTRADMKSRGLAILSDVAGATQ